MHVQTLPLVLAGALFILPAGHAFAQQDTAAHTPVGQTTRAFADSSRYNWEGTAPRPLLTTIWYPAVASVREDTVYAGPPDAPLFIAGTAAHDGELSSAQARYPLVLLSHGTGGAALQMMWLGRHLAAHGYIVAAVNHHGNTAAEEEYTPQGFALWWERTQDLSATLDRLLADPAFGSRIDTSRIGAAGFSLGGYTVLSLAGGLTDVQAYEAFCNGPDRDATCEPQTEFPDAIEAFRRMKDDPQVQRSLARHHVSFRDPRVRAVFAIAPALGGAFTDAGLAPIEIPVHLVAGQADTVAPVATNAQRFADGIEQAELTTLPDVGHYTFLSRCTEIGQRALPQLCVDEAVDRATIHRQVRRLALQFFDHTL